MTQETQPAMIAADDGTAHWTLSFYISRAQIEEADYCIQPTHACKAATRKSNIENFDPREFFDDEWDKRRCEVDRVTLEDERAHLDAQALPTENEKARLSTVKRLIEQLETPQEDRSLTILPRLPERYRSRKIDAARGQNDKNAKLRAAIDPLFNDIADRSRLGRIEDFLIAAKKLDDAAFILPEKVQWSTEGQTYCVPISGSGSDDLDHRRFAMQVRRFWYLHSDGSLSWHVSFRVRYRTDEAGEDGESEAILRRAGSVPTALYLLSLMQKLAYPKEYELPDIEDQQRSDVLVGLQIEHKLKQNKKSPLPEIGLFWNVIESWFDEDCEAMQPYVPSEMAWNFLKHCSLHSINEIPGLCCHDTRSNFFIQDEEFFKLIQPKSENSDTAGELVARRTRILDHAFEKYPKLVNPQSSWKVAQSTDNGQTVELGDAYWEAVMAADADAAGGDGTLPSAAERLLYLFLAGFNQNIIDWTNQEASEVLDSLDPIYPKSDEQLEEGFFIRYANPRCLITYVQRSRTLEVGNDYIGTCPYAFLIHALAMHNERLTRDQEKLAFAVVEKVNHHVQSAERRQSNGERGVGREVVHAEKWISWYRTAAFELFDRHRYANPFRYDTERDVFQDLEKLRGTSQLEKAIDKAFGALDESTRDLERVRAEAEREGERQADRERAAKDKIADDAEKARDRERVESENAVNAHEKARDRKLTALFGLVGLSGLGQLALNVDAYLFDERFADGVSWYEIVPIIVESVLLAAFVFVALRYLREKQELVVPPTDPTDPA